MNLRPPRALIGLTALGALVLAACGADEPDAPSAASPAPAATESTATSGSAPTPAGSEPDATDATTASTAPVDVAAELDGRTFLSTDVEGYELVAGSQIELTFDGANLSAAGGCNRLASTWSLDGDVLVVPAPAATMMACEPAALMDQDTWLSALLTSRATVALDGDTLVLTGDGTVVTFQDQEVANPDRPLEGTVWNLESVISASAVSSFALPTVPTLEFQEDGTLAVNTGCNIGSGGYEVDGSEITVQPIALTRRACIDPNATTVEQAMVTTLNGTVTYEIEADVLTLMNGTDGLQLRAAPEGGTTPEGLEDVSWLLDSIETGNTVSAIAAGVRKPTLELAGGTATVFTGCNNGSGSYTIEGDQITFGPMAMTMMLCQGVTDEVERAVLSVLTGTATAEISDGFLHLTNGDNGLFYGS